MSLLSLVQWYSSISSVLSVWEVLMFYEKWLQCHMRGLKILQINQQSAIVFYLIMRFLK